MLQAQQHQKTQLPLVGDVSWELCANISQVSCSLQKLQHTLLLWWHDSCRKQHRCQDMWHPILLHSMALLQWKIKSSILRPTEETGNACSHAPECLSITAKRCTRSNSSQPLLASSLNLASTTAAFSLVSAILHKLFKHPLLFSLVLLYRNGVRAMRVPFLLELVAMKEKSWDTNQV